MDIHTSLQFVLALVFVLALIGATALAAKRLGLGHQARPTAKRRLAVVEVLSLDGKRRLVLLRRDDVEHLVILSPTSETVVERSLSRGRKRFAAVLAGERAGTDVAVPPA